MKVAAVQNTIHIRYIFLKIFKNNELITAIVSDQHKTNKKNAIFRIHNTEVGLIQELAYNVI